MKNPEITVGLSGGVDSAVAAFLLKQQGYKVTGVFMQNWEVENDDPHCTAEQDLSDARAVCEHLQIPFQVVNFSKEYWDEVFQHCLDEFNRGVTPNPDILCNKEIKFKVFLKYALSLGADYMATGHYARIIQNNNQYQLLKGKDPLKDQSYFLHTLNQQQLSHALFPLGAMQKPEVRQLAQEIGLHNHNKKDSTGVCFIGERQFKTFLKEFLLAKPGDIKTTDGTVIGRHDGVIFYTIGQRRGLNMGGQEQPCYVVDKDLNNNELIVAEGDEHPKLYANTLTCDNVHWVNNNPPKTPLTCKAKTRYRQVEQDCEMIETHHNQYEMTFTQPQRAITPGQSVVFYQGDVCLGGGIIKHI